MTKIWMEQDISSDVLVAHMVDSGSSPVRLDDRRIGLHSENGLAFTIGLDSDKKFLRFSSWLPLDRARSVDAKRAFANRLNQELFLPSFHIDADGDLSISYVMPYHLCLVAGQFMAIANRFASLLDYLVASQNIEALICLDQDEDAALPGTHPDNKGVLLN